MAINRRRDDKNYKDPNRYSEHLKKAFQDEKGSYKFAKVFIPLSSMFLGGFIAMPLSMTHYDGPPRDPGLYTGLFNQTQNYSFVSTKTSSGDIRPFFSLVEEGYFLIRNDEGYALYEADERDSNRLIFVQDQGEALEKMQEGMAFMRRYYAELVDNGRALSLFEELNTPFATCDAISGPFNYQGGIERFQDDHWSCDRVDATPTDAVIEYQNNIDFWENAITQIEAGEYYGVDPDAIIPAEFDDHFVNYLENAGMVSLGFVGLWIGGGLAAGAASTRRKAIKEKQAGVKPPKP